LEQGGLGVLGLSKYSVKSAEAKVTNFTISNINDNNIVYLYSSSTEIGGLTLNFDNFDIKTSNIDDVSEDLKINFYAKSKNNNYSEISSSAQTIGLNSSDEFINLVDYIDSITITNDNMGGNLPTPGGESKQISIKVEINHSNLKNKEVIESIFDLKIEIPEVVAEGGDNIFDVTIDGANYRIHEFTSTGENSIEFTNSGVVDILVVGGGGSGGVGGYGSHEAGGAGAGELIHVERNVEAKLYDITVGEGGSGVSMSNGNGVRGNNGGDSKFDDLIAIGGGGGGGGGNSGLDGGSGGGSDHTSDGGNSISNIGLGTDGGAGTSYLGNPNNTNNDGGGGGGAMESGNTEYLTAGGNGKDLSNTFGTSVGHNGAFAGGGNGGERSNLIRNNIGIGQDAIDNRPLGGGGLPNGYDISGVEDVRDTGQTKPPVPNTGSGSAGIIQSENYLSSDDGSDGIVLIRYRID